MILSRANSEVKVLVADDSAFMRTALTRMIESDASLHVVGTAQTGLEALEKISRLQPDVVTLDIEMPGLNGLETLKRVMRDSPRPVIMVSSLTQEGADTTLEALDLGAFDYVPKQQSYVSLDIVKVRDDLVNKIKAAARSRPCARGQMRPTESRSAAVAAPSYLGVPSIVAIGTSTGGPKALQEILPSLPQDLAVGVLIVQHMPPGFTGPFAKRLNNLCKVTVHEAEPGMRVERGHVYIAPAGKHMTVRRRASSEAVLQVSTTPNNTLHIPSVDVMMLSVAETFRSLAMGVIMTGMGADGALGMKAIFQEGGLTVGQDEATCAVYGMPRSCAEMGILKRVVPLPEIPRQILSALAYRKPH
jgi:two-component system, chemotaxis family, protein-glutamate methylesterase/glutaminase